MIIVYVPCKNKEEAQNIAKNLLGKKLIACANLFDSQSLYFWKNKLENTPETILIMKTQEKHYNEIKKQIKQLHSYELPAIIKFNVEPNKEFEEWIKKETK